MQHVYVTAHGSWSTGPWVGEAAQFGLRLCVSPVIGAPDMGTVFTPQVNGDVVRDQGTAAGTHGTLARTFSCRIGPVGSELNWDAAYQIDVAEDIWTLFSTWSLSVQTFMQGMMKEEELYKMQVSEDIWTLFSTWFP